MSRRSAGNTRGGVRDLTDDRTSGMPNNNGGSGGISGGGNGQPFSLSPIASGDVLANATGSTATPVGTTLSALFDFVFGASRGMILYRGASAWLALAAGVAGYFLQTNGAGADPVWAAVSAGPTSQWLPLSLGVEPGQIVTDGAGNFITVAYPF